MFKKIAMNEDDVVVTRKHCWKENTFRLEAQWTRYITMYTTLIISRIPSNISFQKTAINLWAPSPADFNDRVDTVGLIYRKPT